MSIINNVLKELESRPSGFTSIDVASTSDPEQGQAGLRSIGFILLPAIIVCVIGLIYYQIIYKSEITVASGTSVEAPDPEKVIAPETPGIEKIIPNQITSLQIRETTSNIILEFSLREKAVSYLMERSENRFIYHLKNVSSEIEAPRINNNRWIEKLDILPRQQGIDVVLQTVPGVLVNTARIRKQDETIWTISLVKQPEPVAVAQLEPEPVETEPKTIDVDKASVTKTETASNSVTTDAVSEPVKVQITTTTQSFSASAQLNKAAQLVRARQWLEAEALLQSLLESSQDLAARKQLLGLYSRNGNVESYLHLAEQSHGQYPKNDLFRTEFARALFQHRQYDEVIELLQNSARPDSVQQALMAASYQRKDQHQSAIEHYHHALKLDKGQARNWIGLGVSLEHEAKLEKALQSYQTALRLGSLNERLKQFAEKRSRMLKQVLN